MVAITMVATVILVFLILLDTALSRGNHEQFGQQAAAGRDPYAITPPLVWQRATAAKARSPPLLSMRRHRLRDVGRDNPMAFVATKIN